MRTAVIGIGSNSLRMLLADISGSKLHRVKRYREGLRTFAAIDACGNIEEAMIAHACESVGHMAAEARKEGAESVHLFATSAVRDAKNQQAFIEALENATSLKMEICSGDMEARLSYIGGTDMSPAALIDIGGGSTEIACGENGRIEFASSLQMGAVRLFRAQPIHDVSSAQEVVAFAAKLLEPIKHQLAQYSRFQWIGVGGTFTTLAALAQHIPWDNRNGIHNYALTIQSVESVMNELAVMPLEKRLILPSLQPQRADIVVHGIAILFACMREIPISVITVSEYGNLEGYLKLKYIWGEDM